MNSYEMNQIQEVWYQDRENADFWINERGLMVNSAALDEREAYFEVIRVAHSVPATESGFASGSHL